MRNIENKIYNVEGKVVRRSRNLRGIRLHINRNLVKRVEIAENLDGTGTFKVLFENGDHYETEWASYTVLLWSLRNLRGLYGAPLTINGEDAGTVEHGNEKLQSAQSP